MELKEKFIINVSDIRNASRVFMKHVQKQNSCTIQDLGAFGVIILKHVYEEKDLKKYLDI